MAQRFGGKFSPGAQQDAPSDKASLLAPSLMFLPAIILVFTSIGSGPQTFVIALIGAAVLTLGAWLLREGLIAEAAYDARKVARRPALPRKILAAALTGLGAALAAFTGDSGLIGSALYGIAASGLHVAAFGIDPLKDKQMEGIDTRQQDRVARVVDEAEAYLDVMAGQIDTLNDRQFSIESKRAPVAQQQAVRRWGIILAVALRLVLLVLMVYLIGALQEPFYEFTWDGVLTGGVNFATVVFIFGGIFIMYTAVKEIAHMLSMNHLGHDIEGKSGKSAAQVIALIVFMNLIFSFDSVLSAIAITDVLPVLATAIILSGLAMLLLADGVTRFLEKNRMYEVLGLFILLIVGVVLLGEAGQAAVHGVEAMGAPHEEAKDLALKVFGREIVPMSKSTFYFAVVVLFAVEILQSGYRRKLDAERAALQHHSQSRAAGPM